MSNRYLNKSVLAYMVALALIGLGFYYHQIFSITIGYGALIGALMSGLTIYMLFEKIPLLYGSGILPNHFDQFKQRVRDVVVNQFFIEENIQNLLQATPINFTFLSTFILSEVNFEQLFEELVQVILNSSFAPMLKMVGGERALLPLRESIVEKIKQQVVNIFDDDTLQERIMVHILAENSDKLRSHLSALLQDRLAELKFKVVKKTIQAMIQEQLGWLVIWSGVLGGLMGFIAGLIL